MRVPVPFHFRLNLAHQEKETVAEEKKSLELKIKDEIKSAKVE